MSLRKNDNMADLGRVHKKGWGRKEGGQLILYINSLCLET